MTATDLKCPIDLLEHWTRTWTALEKVVHLLS